MSSAAGLPALLALCLCSGGLAHVQAGPSDAERAVVRCGASFDDFFWRHDIDGRIYFHVRPDSEARLGEERLRCIERWDIGDQRHLFVWPSGERPGRDVISAKAEACGMLPRRDIEWSAVGNGRERAVILDQGASFDQVRCLVEWAEFTGAPVGFASEPADSELRSQTAPAGSPAERQAYDRIATECGLPASTFALVGDDELHFRPLPDSPYESVDCALRKLRESGLPVRTLGFVGNEAPAEVDMSAPGDSEDDSAGGWSVGAPARAEDDTSSRIIISGPADAVDEFTREAEAEGWSAEARASAPTGLVFIQFRAPNRPGQFQSFADRYLTENPRRLNIAGVVANAEVP